MADDDDQSVLRLRLENLRRNLQQVSDTATSVAQRRNDVGILADLFEDDGLQQTGDLLKDISTCREAVEGFVERGRATPLQYERLLGQLKVCEKFATGLKERASRSVEFVRMMGSRWESLSPDNNFDEHVQEIFAGRAKDLIEEIDNLDGEPPTDAWLGLQRTIRAASEELFSEYVDFLGGVALRDTGLGAPAQVAAGNGDRATEQFAPDVYAMADDLVRQIYLIGQNLWHSLTIPARREVVAVRTLARIIRLGFPEWTVWAVPLAAHEFGRVVVDKLELVDACATPLGGVEPGMETILADVFGAYSLGPAYAYASIYLLLDPRAQRLEGESVRSDSERAYAVLGTLDLMNKGGALTGVSTDLRSSWHTAVQQADGIAFPTGNTAEKLNRIIALLLSKLRNVAPMVEFEATRWTRVETWRPLGKLVTDKDLRLRPGSDDVRDILNAAWRQRLNPRLDTEADIDPDVALADAALALWRRYLESRRPGGGGNPHRWR